MIEPVLFGVGGNVGTDDELRARFRQARTLLASLSEQQGLGGVRSAPLYRTAPIGPAQRPFLNTALLVPLDLEPEELIEHTLALERTLGRTRDGERFGPRLIDLDILVWSARVVDLPGLVVPHPRLHERRFALEPLVALLDEDFEIPGRGPAGELLDRVRDQQVELITTAW
jgi:2-amino-4-hydroxy-6-hydroxymethyldihydropteridine diphosphokinase